MVRVFLAIAARSVLLTVALSVFLTTACGYKNPWDVIPVSGKVSYEDGSLIPGHQVLVKFYPQVPPKDPKTHARFAQAEVNPKTGEFVEATTWKYGDGVIPGPQKVTIETLGKTYSNTGGVDPIYSDEKETPLVAEVSASSHTFDFKVPKPKKGRR